MVHPFVRLCRVQFALGSFYADFPINALNNESVQRQEQNSSGFNTIA